MEDGPDTPLWTLTEKEPEEDSPEVPAFPEAYAAYAQVLEEHRELIGDYCKWYEEMGSSIRPVAFTDVCGDSTPEMIFVEADPDLPLSQSHLTIVTFRDGQAATILREDWDFYAGSGLKYTLFQEKDSQPLYAKTSYYTSQKVEERYAFTESEGALIRAEKLQDKARKAGFDWDSAGPALDKLSEETEELRAAVRDGTNPEEELGDLLFAAVKAGRFLGLDSEQALHAACEKFIRRFRRVEELSDKPLPQQDVSALEALWRRAKAEEVPSAT